MVQEICKGIWILGYIAAATMLRLSIPRCFIIFSMSSDTFLVKCNRSTFLGLFLSLHACLRLLFMDSHGIVKPDAHEAFSVDTGGVDQHVD